MTASTSPIQSIARSWCSLRRPPSSPFVGIGDVEALGVQIAGDPDDVGDGIAHGPCRRRRYHGPEPTTVERTKRRDESSSKALVDDPAVDLPLHHHRTILAAQAGRWLPGNSITRVCASTSAERRWTD